MTAHDSSRQLPGEKPAGPPASSRQPPASSRQPPASSRHGRTTSHARAGRLDSASPTDGIPLAGNRGDTELIKAKLADNPPAIESAQTSPEQDTELIKAKLANEAEQARLQGRAMRFYLSALGLGAATSKDAVASVAQKHADVRSDLAKSEARHLPGTTCPGPGSDR